MMVSAVMGEVWEEFVSTKSPALRKTLIEAYAPIVHIVVDRLGISPRHIVEAEDLVSYGMIGLIKAIDRFDPARGVAFETFAWPRIRGEVLDQLRALGWLPRSAMDRIRQVEATILELEQRLGRAPRDVEVAESLGVPLKRYHQMLQEMGLVILSLDAPLNSVEQEDEPVFLAELLEDRKRPGPEQEAEQHELLALLSSLIDQLPQRERMVLALYYTEELSMREIGKVMGISESRVCQLHAQALLSLRASLNVDEGRSDDEKKKGAKPARKRYASSNARSVS